MAILLMEAAMTVVLAATAATAFLFRHTSPQKECSSLANVSQVSQGAIERRTLGENPKPFG
jgi:hypothetical protein